MREQMMPCYAPPAVVFDHGKGMELITDKGEHYLDFVSGIAVNALGHSHPALVHALKSQADKVWHLSNMFRVSEGERLAKRLIDATCMDLVFFTNSGAESVECGLKIMRRYQFDKGNKDKMRIIGFSGSFHGRTIASVCSSGNKKYIEGFTAGDMGFDQVPFGDIDALKAAITDKTGGIIIEPVQGEGGINPVTKEYIGEIRRICDEKDIVLMFDEVQCGVGRTGTLFAYEQLGVEPDVISSAKGIGGGFPLGACLSKAKFGSHMVVGTHGSTFGGNPLAAAVGNAILDVVNSKGFLEHVNVTGHYFREQLTALASRHPKVYGEVSGMGLMLGVKAIPTNGDILVAMRDEEHILIAKAGDNKIRFLPPLIVSKRDIDKLIAALDRVAVKFEQPATKAQSTKAVDNQNAAKTSENAEKKGFFGRLLG